MFDQCFYNGNCGEVFLDIFLDIFGGLLPLFVLLSIPIFFIILNRFYQVLKSKKIKIWDFLIDEVLCFIVELPIRILRFLGVLKPPVIWHIIKKQKK